MKSITVAALCAGTILSACATAPGNIQASYVSPMTYSAYNCDQIREENLRVTSRVQEVSGAQQSRANRDTAAMTVGLVLFWPALFFMANGDQKDELARLKGEYDALQIASTQKQCGMPTQAAAAPAA